MKKVYGQLENQFIILYLLFNVNKNSGQDRYQLWGGCFEEEPSAVLRRLNDSLPVDSRLFLEDIKGSRGWAEELFRSNHIDYDNQKSIQEGLNKVSSFRGPLFFRSNFLTTVIDKAECIYFFV